MLRRLTFTALALAGVLAVPVSAREARHAALVIDANTGAVLHNDSGDELRHPASLTKMMTLYLTFETIESGRLSMDSKITISEKAASAAPSNLELEPGSEISVAEAVKALITKSANDVAVALSEKIGGSQENFVKLMNTRARDLGMNKTHFENASGLPDREQVTTARDMITLGLHLQDDFPKYYPLFALKSFTYDGHTHRNHNTMLNSFEGIDGIKTGYTQASGFNLVSSARRGGRHIVAAVFGGGSASSRNYEMRTLLTRAFTRASSEKTRKPFSSPLIAKLKLEPKIAVRPAPKPKPAVAPVKVAEAKPIPASKPVSSPPAPQPAAVTALSASAAEPAPAPVAPVAPAATVAALLDATTPPAPAPVEVFKVKQTLITPRPPVAASETTDMAAASDSSDDNDGNNGNGLARETIVPKLVASADQSPALSVQPSMLGAADAVPPPLPQPAPITAAPVKAATAPIPSPVKAQPEKAVLSPAVKPARPILAVQRGQPPSTLQAQAAALGSALVSAPAQIRSASLQPSSAASRYAVQIGAFSSVEEAQRALSNAEARGGKAIAGAASITEPAQKDGRPIIRARFAGFSDAARASAVCNELRRQAISCFVTSTE